MTRYIPNIGILTDISANIFAMLILVLLSLLLERQQRLQAGQGAPAAVDLEKDRMGIDRAPLTAGEMVDLLYGRQQGPGPIRVDLFDHGIEVISASGSEYISTKDGVRQHFSKLTETSGQTVNLYVFGHEFYRSVTEALAGAGRNWREISVPQALRQSEHGTARHGWSANFMDLMRRSLDRAHFRTELARLLASPGPSSSQTKGLGEKTAPSFIGDDSVIPRLASLLRGIAAAAAIVAGLAFVLWVETHKGRAK
jgi:hypothetical protein